MRRIPLLLLAAASLAVAERPRYGGVLRIQIQATAFDADERFAGTVFEALTTLDERGRPHPALALSWRSDAGRRWVYRLRGGVVFHDGSALTPAAAAAALAGAAVPEGVAVEFDPVEAARHAVALNGAGSGPFRMARQEPGKRVVLQANEAHWQGRPFLDEVQIELGRTPQQQALDLEAGKADLVEAGPRIARDRARIWSSAPVTLFAITFDRLGDVRMREAIALAIDRGAIHAALLQRQGEVAGGVLPQWISGYAFLHRAARDLPRARELAGANAPPLVIVFDAADPLLRTIAERIAVNARDAGLRLHAAPKNGPADLEVVRLRVSPTMLGLPEGAAPEARYAAERAILDEFRIVPLVHAPDVWTSRPALRTWQTPGLLRTGRWRLADLWMAP